MKIGMAEFDPTIIERYAAYLYRRAGALTRGSVLVGAAFGAVAGAVPLTHFVHWPVPHTFGFATALFGLLAGGVVGFVIGDGRAFNVRLQAQLVLHQLQLERNTAEIVAALREQTEQSPALVPPRLADSVQEPPLSAVIERLA